MRLAAARAAHLAGALARPSRAAAGAPLAAPSALPQPRRRRAAAASADAAPAAAAAAPAPAPAPPADAADAADASKLDIRVGRVLSVEVHPEADSLFVERVDLGEPEGPRTIVSGLRAFVAQEALAGAAVVVLANLKPRNMRGVASNGMLLCASNAEHTTVEPLAPPEGAAVGERAFFGAGGEAQGEAAKPNQLQKKKIWEACQPLLRTNAAGVATFEGREMLTSAGPVRAPTLGGASIS
jgi:aminoacyl tRNA synthase complex-interacting multifunctional protein 1